MNGVGSVGSETACVGLSDTGKLARRDESGTGVGRHSQGGRGWRQRRDHGVGRSWSDRRVEPREATVA